jgi:hypothetical protein
MGSNGMGRDRRRRAAAGRPMVGSGGAAWPVRTHHVAQRRTHRHRAQGPRSTAHGPLDAKLPRRACTASYGGGRRDRARRRARGASARSGTKTVRFIPAQTRFSPKSSTKVHQGLITKVVDHVTSYNFYKGQVVFFSTNRAQNACQDADSLSADE